MEVFRKIRWMLLSLLPLSLLPASGQGIKDSVFTIGEVKVMAPVPLVDRGVQKTGITNIDKMNTSGMGIADIIAAKTPIFVKSAGPGSVASVSFRGTAASHTSVEWNGINLNNPMLGQVDLSLVPVFLADEISILPGGSSLSSGSGALGGIVRIETKPQWDRKLYGSFGQTAGSFSSFQTSAGLGGGNQKIHSHLRYYRQTSENDFKYYNDKTGEDGWYRQKNGNYTIQGGLHEIYYRTGKQAVYSLKTWYQQTNRHFPALMTYSGDGYDEVQDEQELRFSGSKIKYAKKYKMETKLSASFSELDYFASNDTPLGEVVHFNSHNKVNSFVFRNNAEYQLSSKIIIRSILDYTFHQVSNIDFESLAGYDAERKEAGHNLSLHFEIKPWFSFFTLLRTQFTDREFIPLMPSAGLELQPEKLKYFRFMMNVSRNYHLPDLNDLYWIPGGNPDLEPEEGYSSDFTTEFSRETKQFKMNSRLSIYYSMIRNWILWAPGDFNYWQPENLAKVLARGFEVDLKPEWKMSFGKLGVNGNYSYTRTSNVSGEGEVSDLKKKQLIYIPVHKLNASLSMELYTFRLAYNFSVTGKRYTTSSNEDQRHSLPAYDLHDLLAEKNISIGKAKLTAGLSLNNIFNKQYQAVLYRAMPGRSIHIRANYVF